MLRQACRLRLALRRRGRSKGADGYEALGVWFSQATEKSVDISITIAAVYAD